MISAATFDAPSIEYFLLSPMLIVFGGAVLSVLLEAVVPAQRDGTSTGALRTRLQLILSAGSLVAAFVMLLVVAASVGDRAGSDRSIMSGAVIVDGPALFLQGVVLLIGVAAVSFMAERRLDRVWAPADVVTAAGRRVATGGSETGFGSETGVGSRTTSGRETRGGSGTPGGPAGDADLAADAFTPAAATVPGTSDELLAGRAGALTTEVFPLTLFALGGMMLFGACGDLLTMFIALEVLSLPLYLLCGLARRRRLLSQEAALKYFLLGAFASAIFLFGSSFAYGATGSLSLETIGTAVAGDADATLALIALVLIVVGLLFKVGAVPFGSWVPDVYQGAPTPVTALMASATKVAAFGGLLRVLHVGFPALEDSWKAPLWVITIATMVVATLLAVTQTDIKRMLAYSSVSHVGFALVGALTLTDAGIGATLFYVAAYAFAAFGGFALLSVVRDATGREQADLAAWAGLGRRRPLVGLLFSMFLLAFAGIPLTSGFVGKFAVFEAAGRYGAWTLVIVGVLCSAVAVYFYVRVIVSMFFTDPPADAPEVLTPSPLTTVPIAICAALTVALGFFPQPLLDLASHASAFFTG